MITSKTRQKKKKWHLEVNVPPETLTRVKGENKEVSSPLPSFLREGPWAMTPALLAQRLNRSHLQPWDPRPQAETLGWK